MLIRHLDYFVTLAEEAHFGRAAELCGISQPALSQAIRKLEEDLGAPLIVRGQRFEGLTAEGEKVLAWGRQILSDYGSLRADLGGRRKGGLTGVLRLGVDAAAMPLMPAFCERFETRNPLARIRIDGLSPPQILAGIGDSTLDGGFGWATGAAGLRAVPLWPQAIVFACRSDHPFASGEDIALRDAATQPLCNLPDLPVILPPATRPMICSDLSAVLAHLRTGRWCALVPAGIAALLSDPDDIRLLAITDTGPAQRIGAFVPVRPLQSPMVRAFAETIDAMAPPDPAA